MALAILQHQVREAVENEVARGLRYYLEGDLSLYEHIRRNYSRTHNRAHGHYEELLNEITIALETISLVNTKEAVFGPLGKANTLMEKLLIIRTDYERDSTIARRKLTSTCSELQEYVGEYIASLEDREVARSLRNAKDITYSQPLIGSVTIPMVQAMKRVPLRPLIAHIQSNPDVVSPIPLNESCMMLEYEPLPEYNNYDAVYAAVEHLNALALLHNPVIKKFHANLRNALHIEVDLSVGEYDTSKDHLLAELFVLCDDGDDLARMARLIEIGQSLGYHRNELTSLSQRELCTKLQQYFAL